MKCLLRRAELYEKTDKLDEALADYQKALEMDPGLHIAREACMVRNYEVDSRFQHCPLRVGVPILNL